MRLRTRVVTGVAAAFAAIVGGWSSSKIGFLQSFGEESGQPSPVEDPVDGVGVDATERRIARDVPGFGGFFIDIPTQRLQVWLRDPGAETDASKSALRREIGDHPLYDESKIDFRTGQYGFLQLQEWHDQLLQTVFSFRGVVSIDNQEAENRIIIGATNETARSQVQKLVLELDIPEDAVRIEITQPLPPTSSLQDPHRPILGGLQIRRANNDYQCTLGFIANRNGVPGFVTNSHCTVEFAQVDGSVFHQPYDLGSSTRIGVEAVDPPLWYPGGGPPLCPEPEGCRYTDAAWIQLDPGTSYSLGWIARPPWYSTTWNGGNFFRIAAIGSPIVGQNVAKLGMTTGLQAGQVTAINVNAYVGSTDGPLLLAQHFTNIGSGPYDSGGPVFSIPGAGNYDVTLYGISWGGTSSPAVSAFSDVQYMRFSQELGPLDIVQPGGGGR